LSVAVQSGNYPQGVEQFATLQQDLAAANASEDLRAHVAYQKMWGEYVLSQQAVGADAKIQQKWMDDLDAFIAKYPKSPDTAEALLELGRYQEFLGKSEEATKWYQQLATNFPDAMASTKAKGALRRLQSVGKPMQLRGADLQGGRIDLAAAPYRGKVVLIQYWATWSGPSQQDMVLLQNFFAQKGGRDFDIIGVCLDADAGAARQFLAANKFPWKQVYEPGGLEGRLATEMGVMTVPLMILVDQKGNVVNDNVQVADLPTELAKLTQPGGGAANASRNGTTPRK
jgi:hypothetical protein